MAHKHKEDAEEPKVLQSCEKIQLSIMEVNMRASSHQCNTNVYNKEYTYLEPEENIEQQDCSYSCMEKWRKCSRSWQGGEVLHVHAKTQELQKNAMNCVIASMNFDSYQMYGTRK